MDRVLFDVSRWDIMQHREATASNSVPSDSDDFRTRFSDEVFSRCLNGNAHADRIPEENIKDKALGDLASQAHRMLDDLNSFRQSMYMTEGNAEYAAFATKRYMDAVEPILASVEKQENEAPAKNKQTIVRISAMDRAQMRAAMQKASSRVAEELVLFSQIAEASEVLDSERIFSLGSGGDVRVRMQQQLNALVNDERLTAILAQVGRARKLAQEKQAVKSDTVNEITDIVFGNSLERLVPSEMTKFVLMKDQFFMDMLEGRLLNFKLEGEEKKSEGPILVLMDKSGSMQGPSEVWAAGIVAGMLQIAIQQKREFILQTFGGSVRAEYRCTDWKLPLDGLLEASNDFGTDISKCLDHALKTVVDAKDVMRKADVVLVTDGLSDASRAAEIKAFADANKITVHGVHITEGNFRTAEGLEPWCHKATTSGEITDGISNEIADRLLTI